MRRITFYLTVALLAFGISISLVYLYLHQPKKIVRESPKSVEEEISQVTVLMPQKAKEPPRRKDMLTEKEWALLLFEPTLEKWIKDEKTEDTVEPSSEMIQKIGAIRLHKFDEIGLLDTAQKSYKTSLIDVNFDGKKELAIISRCSEIDFCTFRIFKKKQDGDFEVILKVSDRIQKYDLLKGTKNGHFNIETSYEYDEPEINVRKEIYKFDGEKYLLSGCYELQYSYQDKNGKSHNLKKPILHRLEICC